MSYLIILFMNLFFIIFFLFSKLLNFENFIIFQIEK